MAKIQPEDIRHFVFSVHCITKRHQTLLTCLPVNRGSCARLADNGGRNNY